jgi:hypothetical protein
MQVTDAVRISTTMLDIGRRLHPTSLLPQETPAERLGVQAIRRRRIEQWQRDPPELLPLNGPLSGKDEEWAQEVLATRMLFNAVFQKRHGRLKYHIRSWFLFLLNPGRPEAVSFAALVTLLDDREVLAERYAAHLWEHCQGAAKDDQVEQWMVEAAVVGALASAQARKEAETRERQSELATQTRCWLERLNGIDPDLRELLADVRHVRDLDKPVERPAPQPESPLSPIARHHRKVHLVLSLLALACGLGTPVSLLLGGAGEAFSVGAATLLGILALQFGDLAHTRYPVGRPLPKWSARIGRLLGLIGLTPIFVFIFPREIIRAAGLGPALTIFGITALVILVMLRFEATRQMFTKD